MGVFGDFGGEEDRVVNAFRKMHTSPRIGDVVIMDTEQNEQIPVMVAADKSDRLHRCRKLSKLFCADVQGHIAGQWVPISKIKIFRPHLVKIPKKRTGSLNFLHRKALFSKALKIYKASGQHDRTVEQAQPDEKNPLPIFWPAHLLPEPDECPYLSHVLTDESEAETGGLLKLRESDKRGRTTDSEEVLAHNSSENITSVPVVFQDPSVSDPDATPSLYNLLDGKKNWEEKLNALDRLNSLPHGLFEKIVELREKIKSIRNADSGRSLEMELETSISVSEVAPLMSVARDDLCILLDIGVTSWKTFVHHGLGIHRWPGRNIKPIDTNIRTLQNKIEVAAKEDKKALAEALTQELKAAEDERAAKIRSIIGTDEEQSG